jgi:phytanoyl-CoA hydroxylase
MKLSNEQIHSFHENGYLLIKDFYSQAEIAGFQNTLKALIYTSLIKAKAEKPGLNPEDFRGRELHEGLMELEAINHFYVADIYDTLAQSVAFKKLTVKDETEVAINQLLGNDEGSPLYTYTCRCRIDPPADNRRTYGWHQEVFYSIPRSRFLQTWAPLVDPSTEQNGTVEVCVGSHKQGIAPQSWNEIKGRALQIIVDEQVTQRYEKKKILMPVGDLMIFDFKLFHRSGDNSSDRVRYSLVGMYHDATNPEFYSANVSLGFKKTTPQEYFKEVIGNLS